VAIQQNKKSRYIQLTKQQRYQVEVLKEAKNTQKQIARIMGVPALTISRELKRNSGQRDTTLNKRIARRSLEERTPLK
jgi:IS30 family transposase